MFTTYEIEIYTEYVRAVGIISATGNINYFKNNEEILKLFCETLGGVTETNFDLEPMR